MKKCHEEKPRKYLFSGLKTGPEKTAESGKTGPLTVFVTYNSKNRLSPLAKAFNKKGIHKKTA